LSGRYRAYISNCDNRGGKRGEVWAVGVERHARMFLGGASGCRGTSIITNENRITGCCHKGKRNKIKKYSHFGGKKGSAVK